jgi:hypothetical protein
LVDGEGGDDLVKGGKGEDLPGDDTVMGERGEDFLDAAPGGKVKLNNCEKPFSAQRAGN